MLHLEPGENAANVALTKVKQQPSMFDHGIVTAARSEKENSLTRLVATLAGKRSGRAAQLEITLTKNENSPGTGVDLKLSESGKDIRFRCFPDIVSK